MRPVEGFGFVHREQVRFRDLDAMGHVNNAVFMTYVESARIAYLLERGAVSDLANLAMIVARVEVDFRSPASYGETVEVGVRTARFGTKSFDLEFELRAGRRLVAEAKTVCVGYDYGRGETIAVPETWKERLAA